MNKFTLNGKMQLHVQCQQGGGQKQNGNPEVWEWSKEYVEDKAKSFGSCGAYGSSACLDAVTKHNSFINGKVGMVLGTQIPWAEGGLLKHGAAKVITQEYNPIRSLHPQVVSITPLEIAQHWLNHQLEPVDFIFTYSSLEHDGLGRYGDPINPYGDLEAISRAHCLLKPGGILFLGFGFGVDVVNYISHRIYGKYRRSVIMHLGWEPIDIVGNYLNATTMPLNIGQYDNQAIWVLRKKDF